MIEKPMLADTCTDMSTVKFPVLVSPKLDGVRCLIRNGVAVSRNLKPIPNVHVQRRLAGLRDGLDGELIIGRPTQPNVFTNTQSIVMSQSKVLDGLDFAFHVFDFVKDGARRPFCDRFRDAQEFIRECDSRTLEVVPHELVSNHGELESIEAQHVEAGYEGVMIRDINGPYKFGRSTVREGYLLKVKRFQDDEAIVVSAFEQMHNENAKERNALGRTERSTKKDGLVPAGVLGGFVCRWRGTTFDIGTGFNADQRDRYWKCRGDMIGRTAKFKYQGVGVNGRPRFPVFIAWENEGK